MAMFGYKELGTAEDKVIVLPFAEVGKQRGSLKNFITRADVRTMNYS